MELNTILLAAMFPFVLSVVGWMTTRLEGRIGGIERHLGAHIEKDAANHTEIKERLARVEEHVA